MAAAPRIIRNSVIFGIRISSKLIGQRYEPA